MFQICESIGIQRGIPKLEEFEINRVGCSASLRTPDHAVADGMLIIVAASNPCDSSQATTDQRRSGDEEQKIGWGSWWSPRCLGVAVLHQGYFAQDTRQAIHRERMGCPLS